MLATASTLTTSSLAPSSPTARLHDATPAAEFQIDASAIRTGDLVFRRGRTWLSRAVVEADAGSRFSHVGLAVVDEGLEGGEVFVIHATPGDGSTASGVVSEPLASYLSPSSAQDAAVLRVGRPDAARAAADRARTWARLAVPFDGAFEAGYDDAWDGALYCTELVWKAYLHAGVDLLDGRFDTLDLPLGPDRYVLPSSLLASKHLTEIHGRDS